MIVSNTPCIHIKPEILKLWEFPTFGSRDNYCYGMIIYLIKYSEPDKCHFRNWRNFLVQPLVLGPTVDTYVESH